MTLVCSYYREVPKKILSPEDALALSEIAMDQDTLRCATARATARARDRDGETDTERLRETERES